MFFKKKLLPCIVLAIGIMTLSKLVVFAVSTAGYSLTPAGFGDYKISGTVLTKQNTSSGTNKCTKVQNDNTLWCFVDVPPADGGARTHLTLFTTGQKVYMDYLTPSSEVNKKMVFGVQSRAFDSWGRNTYGYWSPDQF